MITYQEIHSLSRIYASLFDVPYNEAKILPCPVTGAVAAKFFENDLPVFAIIFDDDYIIDELSINRIVDNIVIYDCDIPINAAFNLIANGEVYAIYPLLISSLIIDHEKQYENTLDQAVITTLEMPIATAGFANALGLYDYDNKLQIHFISELLESMEFDDETY